MAQIDSLLHMAVQSKASDVHVATGSCFILRQFGRLRPIKSAILTPEAVKEALYMKC